MSSINQNTSPKNTIPSRPPFRRQTTTPANNCHNCGARAETKELDYKCWSCGHFANHTKRKAPKFPSEMPQRKRQKGKESCDTGHNMVAAISGKLTVLPQGSLARASHLFSLLRKDAASDVLMAAANDGDMSPASLCGPIPSWYVWVRRWNNLPNSNLPNSNLHPYWAQKLRVKKMEDLINIW